MVYLSYLGVVALLIVVAVAAVVVVVVVIIVVVIVVVMVVAVIIFIKRNSNWEEIQTRWDSTARLVCLLLLRTYSELVLSMASSSCLLVRWQTQLFVVSGVLLLLFVVLILLAVV